MAEIAWQIIACVLIADFIAGFGHWFEDTYGLPTWPLVGKHVIEPNINHHRKPTAMVKEGSFVDRNFQPCLLMGVALIPIWCAGLLNWQCFVVAFVVGFSNQIHGWTHGGNRNPAVRILQDMALLQTPVYHAKHHKPPYAIRFCVITHVVNTVLDGARFWRGLEYLISCFGVHPKRMTVERDGF